MDRPIIIDPNKRKVGEIKFSIWNNGETNVEGTEFGSIGQRKPMLPFVCARLMVQAAASIMVQLETGLPAQQEGSQNNGDQKNGKTQ